MLFFRRKEISRGMLINTRLEEKHTHEDIVRIIFGVCNNADRELAPARQSDLELG
jgi:hypothetical protein